MCVVCASLVGCLTSAVFLALWDEHFMIALAELALRVSRSVWTALKALLQLPAAGLVLFLLQAPVVLEICRIAVLYTIRMLSLLCDC
jgi:hypothetical protein